MRDIAREVTEDVRDTVRNLREELTWAARDVRAGEAASRRGRTRQGARPAHQGRGQGERPAGQGRGPAAGAGRAADEPEAGAPRQAGADAAGARPGRPARQLREDGQAGRDQREEARARPRPRPPATGPTGPRRRTGRAGPDGAARPGGGRGAAAAGPAPPGLDAGLFRDLERLAVDFARELRRAAWNTESIGENALGDLRSILEDALARIKNEVFGGTAAKPGSDQASDEEDQTRRSATVRRRRLLTYRGPAWVYTVSTTLPNRSPEIIAARPSRGLASGSVRSISGRTPVCSQNRSSRAELVPGAHRRPDHGQLQEEHPVQVGGRHRAAGRAGDHDRPPGLSERSECAQVASPTVSITASTRSGSRAPGRERLVRAEREGPVPLGLAAAGGPDPVAGRPAEQDQRGGDAAARALHQHRGARLEPGPAEQHPVGGQVRRRQARGLARRTARRAWARRLRRGTATRSANVPS